MSQSVALPTKEQTLDLEVQKAARAFAQALTESDVFQAFEQAAEHLGQDKTAQEAILAFQKKQQSLQMMLMLNAVSQQDREELERLQKAFLNQPSVAAYLRAQEGLTNLCTAAANLLGERTGLSFTAACGPGGC